MRRYVLFCGIGFCFFLVCVNCFGRKRQTQKSLGTLRQECGLRLVDVLCRALHCVNLLSKDSIIEHCSKNCCDYKTIIQCIQNVASVQSDALDVLVPYLEKDGGSLLATMRKDALCRYIKAVDALFGQLGCLESLLQEKQCRVAEIEDCCAHIKACRQAINISI
jgi:hypothetical protein